MGFEKGSRTLYIHTTPPRKRLMQQAFGPIKKWPGALARTGPSSFPYSGTCCESVCFFRVFQVRVGSGFIRLRLRFRLFLVGLGLRYIRILVRFVLLLRRFLLGVRGFGGGLRLRDRHSGGRRKCTCEQRCKQALRGRGHEFLLTGGPASGAAFYSSS